MQRYSCLVVNSPQNLNWIVILPSCVSVLNAVNMEHPAPSDNNKENSEKKGAKQQNQQPSGFEKSPLLPPMEQRSTVGKNAGLLDAEQDYTPQDIAEYIFWTGDERRIALALNDFLQDQLVSEQSIMSMLTMK